MTGARPVKARAESPLPGSPPWGAAGDVRHAERVEAENRRKVRPAFRPAQDERPSDSPAIVRNGVFCEEPIEVRLATTEPCCGIAFSDRLGDDLERRHPSTVQAGADVESSPYAELP